MSRFLRKVLFGRATWMRSAVLFIAVLGLLHLLGWRENTAVISGTTVGASFYGSALRGVLYGISWFAAVIVSPILILAMGIDAILRRLGRTNPSVKTPGSDEQHGF